MNVTIDSMKATSSSRVLWWVTLLCVVVLGLALRLTSIDRGTPGLGAFVYFGMLTVLATLIALPTSAACALVWSLSPRFLWLERTLAHRLRITRDVQVRVLATSIAALLTFVVCVASGRLPRWHVWMSVTAVNALMTWRWFTAALAGIRADDATRETQRANAVALRASPTDLCVEAFTALRCNTAFNLYNGAVPNFASDDRRARARWRGHSPRRGASRS